jgi:hypothetical protein
MKKKKYNKDFEKHSKNKLYQFKIEKNNHKLNVSMFYFYFCPKNCDNRPREKNIKELPK